MHYNAKKAVEAQQADTKQTLLQKEFDRLNVRRKTTLAFWAWLYVMVPYIILLFIIFRWLFYNFDTIQATAESNGINGIIAQMFVTSFISSIAVPLTIRSISLLFYGELKHGIELGRTVADGVSHLRSSPRIDLAPANDWSTPPAGEGGGGYTVAEALRSAPPPPRRGAIVS